MTRIRILGKDGQISGFEVSGHAGAGQHGEDLVCAAISFLATTAVNALESVAGERPKLNQNEGYLKATLEENQLNPAADVILKTLLQGAKDLQEAYPKHVRLLDESK